MEHALRSGLSFCEIGEAIIFIDIVADRYFRLRDDLTESFKALADGGQPSEDAVAALLRQKIVQPAAVAAKISAPRLAPAAHVSAAIDGAAKTSDLVRAVAAEVRAERKLKSIGLAASVEALTLLKRRREMAATIDDPLPARAIRASEVAKLVRSPANRCLPRSIGLVARLAQLGCAVHLVLAVRSAPFAAHSWAQVGDIVLNDTVEEVGRYTPIFVA
ncbi:lasso peptide biosynthesis B2 protein [uncultured Sphingomonas sp.]|uniref:lasso peptide biosynthesis B2 protein n=1 Tax=uncultured Sphingomonas sp. TaxID=158754 RepID=UPI002602AE69|nr:lasso peptide biosynthesis B2 protein [uncultured Sphingomonas sp.]